MSGIALTPSLGVITCEYHYKWYAYKLDHMGYISLAEYAGVSSTTFT